MLPRATWLTALCALSIVSYHNVWAHPEPWENPYYINYKVAFQTLLLFLGVEQFFTAVETCFGSQPETRFFNGAHVKNAATWGLRGMFVAHTSGHTEPVAFGVICYLCSIIYSNAYLPRLPSWRS